MTPEPLSAALLLTIQFRTVPAVMLRPPPEPVPMFPFPGSPLYVQTFGAAPDDQAWERAHLHYTNLFDDKGYSDIQEQRPARLQDLDHRDFVTIDSLQKTG